ncbi:hypothetical protein COL154_003704, partial [Colletotrichum chrysophilum]
MTNHLCNLGVLSPDGKSYSFDEKANGYARGEGIAVVILKRVSDAIRDGNTIRGIIRNIGCNQDGKSPGVTMPTAEAQSSLMNRLYTEAGLDPGATRYFEAHATGTAVGDPIEMSAINSVFSKRLSAENPMYVGSVKTNVGHLEGAAGLAGLLKSVYILESGIIPKNLWFEKWNPQVQLDESLFLVPTTAVPWPDNTPRRISLNSFGIGDVLSMNTEKLNIETPALSHPTVTALQVALVDLLHSWSAAPHAVIGHSSGEIAAAYASSAISREISLGREEAKTYVEKVNQQDSEGHVTIACINSPKSVTISGSAKAIDLLSSLLDSDGIFGRKLRVVNAYHSSHMDPIAEEYASSIGTIEPGTALKGASVPKFFSSYLGRQASAQDLLDPAYWVGNLLSPVEFSDGLQAMMGDSVDDASTSKKAAIGLLVEVGPHSVLQSPIRDILQITSGVKDVTYT